LARKLALPCLLQLVPRRILLHNRPDFPDFILDVVPYEPALLLFGEPRFVRRQRRCQSFALLRGLGDLLLHLLQLPRQCVYVLLLHCQALDHNQSLAELPDFRQLRGRRILVGDNFHRFLLDDATRRYVGYDVILNKRSDGMLALALAPLSVSAERLGLKGEWTQVPLRVNSTPQIVKPGDEIAIDMFGNPATGQKIVDHLFFDNSHGTVRLPEGTPRDFTVEDVPLTLASPKILLNGKQLEAEGGTGEISGEAVYFYLPGHGRYAMSLAPNPELGFRNLGEVRGSTISFRNGSDTWTVACKRPIAPGGGVFNLYVYPDPAWRPSTGEDSYHLGASSARSIIRK
jgi:hypothetical protein